MLKNIVRLEHKVADRYYQLLCENDSPLEHIKEALFQFQKFVGQIEDQVKVQQESIKNEEVKSEESKESVIEQLHELE